jgi:molybdate transport system regulatory protein
MELSARNPLKGKVTNVTLGQVMAEVAVDVSGQEVVAAITCSSAERMRLKPGDEIVVVFKATEIMIGRP